MPAKYKLTYFDAMGAAEPIRYLMAYGGLAYDNVVIDRQTEWPTMMTKYPFQRLPVMEMDGKMMIHSVAICRWLAPRVGLHVEDEMTRVEVDGLVETMYDFYMNVAEWYFTKDPVVKKYHKERLDTGIVPLYMKNYEEYLMKKGGYFGGKMSWVDLYFVGMMDSVETMMGLHLMKDKHPVVYQMYLKVQALPQIKAYVAKRTHYDY